MIEILLFLLPPFVACSLMLLIFGYFGIHVLKREVIFIDIAMAQMAAVGSAIAFVLWRAEASSLLAYGAAFMMTVLSALFYAVAGKRIKQIPHEAIIGVSYAIAAAAMLFMLALSAGGDEHLEHMLTGAILWASWGDILLCGVIFLMIGAIHWIFRKQFICLSNWMEETNRHEKSALWDFIFYLTLGVVITISVRIAGVLVIFSFLIMPATLSGLIRNSWRSRLSITWASGLIATVLGLIFSYVFDFSCGPSVVSFLTVLLILTAIFTRKRSASA